MRIFITMLAHNRSEVVRGAMENLEATTTDAEHRRLVKTAFLCQYPLPSVEHNREEIIKLAREFGWWHAEVPNKGVMANHNTALHDYCHIEDGDFYVTFDPDVRMDKPGWISAMIEALNSDPTAMFCSSSMYFHSHEWMQKPPHNRKVTTLPSGLRIARWSQLIAWPSGMWKGEFLKTRPRHFSEHMYYGCSEFSDHDRLIENGKTWMSVPDYIDNHLGAPDPEYLQWKQESAAGKTSYSFNIWLEKRK